MVGLAMTQSQVKSELRNFKFPQCVTEGLTRIERLYTSGSSSGRAPAAHEIDLAKYIMAEFIFMDGESGSTKKLSECQQVILMNVICNFFNYAANGNEAIRNTVFMSLFPASRSSRLTFLYSLVSMAIIQKNIPVLTATGVWMQQLGCTNKCSLDLAKYLVTDYFELTPKALDTWDDLPKTAPQFTANLLTTVAAVYTINEGHIFKPPPRALLEIVTRWISDNPTLCLAALLVDLKPAMPTGAIPMTAVTPFAGLFMWCVLAPLFDDKDRCEIPANKSVPNEITLLYSRLHLALLNSLLECRGIPAGNNVLSAQHLSAIVEPILHYLPSTMQCDIINGNEKDIKAINVCVDRFAQAVEVALAVKCIYGNPEEFFSPMMKLREFPFIRIVLMAQGIQV